MFALSRSPLSALPVMGLSLALAFIAGCNRDPNVRKQKYLESGKRYEQEGKYREAAIQFSNALKVDHNFAQAHFELGMDYIKMGTIISAYSELSHAVDLNPANLPAQIQLANMELAGAQPDRAAERVKAILAVDPNNADAYAISSNIAALKRDHAGAVKQIQHALQIQPDRTDFRTTYAVIESSEPGGEANAEQELNRAIALEPTKPEPHLILAALLMKKGDFPGAESQTQQAIKIAPKDLQSRRNLASIYYRAGNRSEAEQTLRQASGDISDTAEGAQLLSDFYLAEGQLGQADSAYEDLVAKHPDSAELKFAYARILILEHKDDKAQVLESQLAKKNANSPEVQILHAARLLNQSKPSEAFDILQAAVKANQDNYDLQFALGRVSLQKDDLRTAEQSFQEAGKLSPGNQNVAGGLAEVEDRKGDYNQLAQIAEASLSKSPQLATAYVWRGTAEANLKQTDLADRDFQKALSLDGTNVAALAELGQMRMRQNRIPEGSALIEKALDADPGSVFVLNLLTSYYVENRQLDKAIGRLHQQLDRVPGNIGMLTLLAETQLAAGDFNGARDSSGTVFSKEPGNERALQTYAKALAGTGNVDGAIGAWQRWIDAHPSDGLATTMLAQIVEAKGDAQHAEDLYKRSLQLDPHQVEASNNLAYLMVNNNQNLDIALTLAQDAQSGSHNNPGTSDTLAWVLYSKGRYSSARDLLEEALRNDPNNADAHFHLGMTYAKLGDRSNSILHLKRAVVLAPNTQTAKNAAAALAA